MRMENEAKGLCVVCDAPVPNTGSFTCVKCGKICKVEITPAGPKSMATTGKQVFVIGDAKSRCCGADVEMEKRLTCSPVCHEKYVQELIDQFGRYKKVVDAPTGIAYRVPTRDIIEIGVHQTDLPRYPRWEDDPSGE